MNVMTNPYCILLLQHLLLVKAGPIGDSQYCIHCPDSNGDFYINNTHNTIKNKISHFYTESFIFKTKVQIKCNPTLLKLNTVFSVKSKHILRMCKYKYS